MNFICSLRSLTTYPETRLQPFKELFESTTATMTTGCSARLQ